MGKLWRAPFYAPVALVYVLPEIAGTGARAAYSAGGAPYIDVSCRPRNTFQNPQVVGPALLVRKIKGSSLGLETV